ncbi:hypothetical protein [Chryseobacterium luquanense]|uniref:Uncharacterized protein n=1 Tax=Chryseobacterium luquanense TaxID=2983766 RepID=A0ABT3XZI5_9FLAO|nr:hypothetical protein [Chryseobacterium luquanense]MCX8531297.1 hypothetical protein [Chryseobacterium luquanense]
MKISLILLFSCFLALNCQSKKDSLNNKFTGWTSHNLIGKVKEITIKSFKIDSIHNTKKQEGLYHKFEFSTTGNELIYNIYDENDVLKFKSTPKYNNGKIVSSTIDNIEEKTTENWVIKKYLLDFYGGEIECYIDNKLVKKVFNTINKKGHQTSLKVFSNDNKILYEKSLEYDDRENLIKTTDNSYANDTVYSIKSSFIYTKFDKNNNWIERTDKVDGKFLLTERSIVYY